LFVLSNFFFQAEDGIRDFHVTGVQTCALPIFIPLSVASLFVVFPILNNISLSKFEKQFERYPLPEETSLIEVKSVVGKLNGNGNSIDFFVGLLIQSELSKDELTHYYVHAQYAVAKVVKRNVLIEVLTVED